MANKNLGICLKNGKKYSLGELSDIVVRYEKEQGRKKKSRHNNPMYFTKSRILSDLLLSKWEL